MSGSGEIFGDMVHDALIARAVEPGHGDAGDSHSHEAACLNCATLLMGTHCHACGQSAHVHKTIGAFFHDLLHGVFHFEGKIWRTVPMLVFRPGRLTREYADGRRASYVSPIALFLFCVFLMFAAIQAFGGTLGENSVINVNGNSIRGLESNERELVRLKQLRTQKIAQHERTDGLDGQIVGRETAIEQIRAFQDGGKTAIKKLPDQQSYSYVPAIDRAIHSFKDNPALALFKLQANAYKYAWALIPLSVPLVWLLFPFNRRFGLYDHTVFVTYSLCFMMLLVAALSVLNGLHIPLVATAGLLLPPWHLYRQTKDAYGLTRSGAIWRTGALMVFAVVALSLFSLLILAESGA